MTDGFPDTPGRDATPEEEARVAALLAGLRDDDIPMPDDVWTRLSAVIAEEQASAARGAGLGAATALTDTDDSTPSPSAVTVSVLPDAAARARRRRGTTWVLGAAAAVVAVALVGGLVRGGLAGSGSSSSAGAASAVAAPSDAAVTAERVSNTAYTHAQLASQVAALVSGRTAFDSTSGLSATGAGSTPANAGRESTAPTPTRSAAVVTGTATAKGSAGGSATGTSGTPGPLSGAALADCLTQLTGTAGATAIAVDRGTYEGKPADVVVVPTQGDPASLDVWVLSPGCSASNADVLELARIPRP